MKINYLIVDVDGTLTDGGIIYDEYGNETKRFNSRDAAGFFAAEFADIKIIVLTGRSSKATERRMQEMHVKELHQNVKNKEEWIAAYVEENSIKSEELGYIGDDLNDLCAMKLAGFIACPLDGCREIKGMADYISTKRGGEGVLRDVVEYLLRKTGEWDQAVHSIYCSGKTGD